MPASEETKQAYRDWLAVTPNATHEEQFSVFRLYDNYAMSEEEAMDEFVELNGPVQQTLDALVENEVAMNSQVDEPVFDVD